VSADIRTVIIGCAHSAGPARDGLRTMDQTLPRDVEWLEVPCGGAIDDLLILRAFEAGADRVMVLACNDGACQSMDGNRRAERRVKATRQLLEEVGIEAWRLEFHHIGPNMSADLLMWVNAFRSAISPADEAIVSPTSN